ncbi:MAG: RNA methyltransferase, partial [Treponema sp.]|nr:RNA methyltransferase [Treponema sp.]
EFCQKGNVESAVKKSSPADSRWQKVITEAREQSGSPVQTVALPCKKFDEALAFWKEVPGGGLLGEALGPEAAERGSHERGTAGPAAPGSAKMAFVLYERSEGTLPVHRAVSEALARAFVPQAQMAVQEVPVAQTASRANGRAISQTAGLAISRANGHSSPLKNALETADIAVMVGAEGGISPSELEKAKESGFIPVHLETNILRCETAALYGLAIIQGAVMESDIWKLNE